MIRVGVCDDDPLVLRLVVDVIGRADDLVVVAACRSGDEAIAVDDPVDVWLMDRLMPGMTGIEACQVLTAGTDPPRVLILTASTTETVSEAYRAARRGICSRMSSRNDSTPLSVPLRPDTRSSPPKQLSSSPVHETPSHLAARFRT